MKICGIICEYNPFHNGHAFQMRRTRELLGDDTFIVCLMSGHFVQRGDAALYHKSIRAKAAVLEGADLVLELPTPYSLSSAEGFASASVDILSRFGCTHLSFGAEEEDLDSLWEIALLLLEKSVIDDTLAHMTEGISYAAARERAIFSRLKERSELLKKPNNILAIEYLKAIISQKSPMLPVAVKRLGAGHDSCEIKDGTASATHIRQCLTSGLGSVLDDLVPERAAQLFKGAAMHSVSFNPSLVMSSLIRLSPEDFTEYADVSEGLEHRLFAAVSSSFSLDEVCEKARSKRYPYARIRRIGMNVFLGIKKADVPLKPPYVKVLAFNDNGRKILSRGRKNEDIAVITKPAKAHDLGCKAQSLVTFEQRAGRLWHMLGNSPFTSEFVSPVYVKNENEQ